MTTKSLFAALALVAASFGASATTPTNTFDTIYGVTLGNGTTKHLTFLGGVSADFAAFSGNTAAKFNTKPGQDGFQGIGVTGKTQGEIDIGETIVGSFSQAVNIKNFKVGLLFDGPEYGDVNEKAKISVKFKNDSIQDFYLTAVGETTALWSGSGGSVLNLSKAKNALGGAWEVSNPFGNALVKSITFGATLGACGSAGGACGGYATGLPKPRAVDRRSHTRRRPDNGRLGGQCD